MIRLEDPCAQLLQNAMPQSLTADDPTDDSAFDLVHGPLAYWAEHAPSACALSCEDTRLSYRQLHEQVRTRAAQLQTAPATLLLKYFDDPVARLVEFLGIITSGRCAAIPDPDWPSHVHEHIAALLQPACAREIPSTSPESPFYIGFTSGSTGVPKGFERHHRSWTESFRVAIKDFGPAATRRVLSPGRLSHSLFLFGALLGIWTGAGAELQEQFSASDALASLSKQDTPVLIAVPSQLVMMLDWSQRRAHGPIHGVELVLISGARWMRDRTPALRALFPRARIVEFYGASETSFIAWIDADEKTPLQAVGRPFSNVLLHIGPDPDTAPASAGSPGLIWVRSPMHFIDYVGGADSTAAARTGSWLSVRDMGYVDETGMLHLCGRENRMLVTQGKNLFVEEVEARLMAYPGVLHASLLGRPDALRGQSVVAVLVWDEAVAPRPSALDLANWCKTGLERYKTPRQWWRWSGPWPRTAGGKTDHAAISQAVKQAIAQKEDAASIQRTDKATASARESASADSTRATDTAVTRAASSNLTPWRFKP